MLERRWRCRRRLLYIGLGVSSLPCGLILVYGGWAGWLDMHLGGRLGRRGGLLLSYKRLAGSPVVG